MRDRTGDQFQSEIIPPGYVHDSDTGEIRNNIGKTVFVPSHAGARNPSLASGFVPPEQISHAMPQESIDAANALPGPPFRPLVWAINFLNPIPKWFEKHTYMLK